MISRSDFACPFCGALMSEGKLYEKVIVKVNLFVSNGAPFREDIYEKPCVSYVNERYTRSQPFGCRACGEEFVELTHLTIRNPLHEIIVPRGKYYIGDPCYVFRHTPEGSDLWDRYVEHLYSKEGNEHKPFVDGNIKIWARSTAHGDGCYRDNCYNEYSVDAGLIGIVQFDPEDPRVHAEENFVNLGRIVVFDSFARCWSEDGSFKFGNIFIETDYGKAGDDD